MPGVFDRLQNRIADRSEQGGISPLELRELSPGLRKIMRLMLRELEMTLPDLRAAMAALPEDVRITGAQLDGALTELTAQQWLIRRGADELITYKVNLRRKSGSALGGMWSDLDFKIQQSKANAESGEAD